MTVVHAGDPARHRRALGRLAARQLDVRVARYPAGTAWRPLDQVAGTSELVVTAGAFCAFDDVDAAVAVARGVLAPGGELRFLEHIGRPGAAAWVHRAADPLWSRFGVGCHVDHDVPAALRRGGFVVTDLERCTMPTAVPFLRPWVHGVATVRP